MNVINTISGAMNSGVDLSREVVEQMIGDNTSTQGTKTQTLDINKDVLSMLITFTTLSKSPSDTEFQKLYVYIDDFLYREMRHTNYGGETFVSKVNVIRVPLGVSYFYNKEKPRIFSLSGDYSETLNIETNMIENKQSLSTGNSIVADVGVNPVRVGKIRIEMETTNIISLASYTVDVKSFKD